jgi:hypothetical protein
MNDLETAHEWRAENGYIGRGGVIVIFDGLAQGWVNELRNPEAWRPGCIAVDETGHSWIAVGGNEQDGASKWMPMDTYSRKKRARIRPKSIGEIS